MTLNEKLIEALLIGDDLDDASRGFARAFLSHVYDQCPSDVADVAAVLARRLMTLPDWRTWMTVAALREFCAERRVAITLLRALPITATCDPEAEYFDAITGLCAARLQQAARLRSAAQR